MCKSCQRQCKSKVNERYDDHNPQVVAHGDSQYISCQQQDCGEVDARQGKIGHHLGKDDAHGAHGRHEQHVHGACLFLAYYRHRGEDGANQDKDHAHDAWHKVEGALHLGVEEHVGLYHACARHQFAGKNVGQVAGARLGNVGVGGIHDKLHRP